MPQILELSTLRHTWLIDLDGTVVKHNGYKTDGHDTLLGGAKEFMEQIPAGDVVIFITSRDACCREQTAAFLRENKIRYDDIIFGVPFGERILINDQKPGGLRTAVSVNVFRDAGLCIEVKENCEI